MSPVFTTVYKKELPRSYCSATLFIQFWILSLKTTMYLESWTMTVHIFYSSVNYTSLTFTYMVRTCTNTWRTAWQHGNHSTNALPHQLLLPMAWPVASNEVDKVFFLRGVKLTSGLDTFSLLGWSGPVNLSSSQLWAHKYLQWGQIRPYVHTILVWKGPTRDKRAEWLDSSQKPLAFRSRFCALDLNWRNKQAPICNLIFDFFCFEIIFICFEIIFICCTNNNNCFSKKIITKKYIIIKSCEMI